ncbi:MAG: hypothetical protein AAGJ67_06810 [Pseudomonadota bacterium]
MSRSHGVQPVWLNAFEQLQLAPHKVALTPSEHALIGPWRALNDPESARPLFKTSAVFPALPAWVKETAQSSNQLVILYVHRYAKLDCKTPFLPWLTHQLGGGVHSLGLRHDDEQLSSAHLDLACAWVQEGKTVLVVFDHIKVIETAQLCQQASFLQYALLSTTPYPLTTFTPRTLDSCLPLAPPHEPPPTPTPTKQVSYV